MTSIVTGTEQRIYGFLSSNCNIWLKRFAICLGSSTLNPSIYTGTVVYGDTVHYKQCGYKYNGYLSLLFIASGATLPYAVFEVRKCASGKNYIFIDSYGEVASSTLPLSLWFNQGTEIEPDWVFINSCTSGILQRPASETTFKFIENKGSSISTELGCCKKCTGCECLTCVIYNRFSENSIIGNSSNIINYGKLSLGTNTIIFTYINVEYKINCGTIDIWIYKTDSVTTGLNLIIKYYNDSNTWIELYNGLIDDLEQAKFTVSFDYLKNCTTTTLTISGCKTVTSAYPSTLPVIASLWNYTIGNSMDVTLTANLTTTSKKQCLDSSTYTDFTWDLDYGNTPIIDTGKIITYEFPKIPIQLPYITKATKSYNVFVKTGDIYLSNPKYLSKTNNSCVTVDSNYGFKIGDSFGSKSGITINGVGFYPSMTAYAYTGTDAIYSFIISTTPDPDSIYVTSRGREYYMKLGRVSLPSNSGYVQLFSNGSTLIAWCVNVAYKIDISTGSIIGTYSVWNNDRSMGSNAVVYEGHITSAMFTGSVYTRIYDIDTLIYNPVLTSVTHSPWVTITSGTGYGVVANNVLYLFRGASYNILPSLSDYGPTSGISIGNSPLLDGHYFHSVCEHKGRIYLISSYNLLEFDPDIGSLSVVIGINVDSNSSSLVSYGNYLVVAGNRLNGYFDILTDEDLGI